MSTGSLLPHRLPTILAAILLVVFIAVVATQSGLIPGLTDRDTDVAQITVTSENGDILASITARVADSPSERYQGLSGTDRLPDGSGMLFVFDGEGQHSFVMRGMKYPLDMVFIGSDGRITIIHHAPLPPPGTPEGELTFYGGLARWVIEVPYGYTSARGIFVGDRVTITYVGP